MRIYRGERREDGCFVEVIVVKPDGTTLHRSPLDLHLELFNHSPDGFEWGYGGSGPAQLALAILADCLGAAEAKEHHQAFKADVIARLNCTTWSIDEELVAQWHVAQHV